MSFILDALKKSESDRQRQSGPALFEVKVAAPGRRLPAWAIAILVLVVLNIAVMSWMLLRPAPSRARPTSAAVSSPPAAAASTAVAAPSAPAVGSMRPVARLAGSPQTAPSPRPSLGGHGFPQPAPTASGQAPVPSAPLHGSLRIAAAAAYGSPAGARASAAAARIPAQAGGQVLPLYQQLASAPGGGLPILHLDLHVYSANPRRRYVMINMHTLRTGDSLPDGVQVIAIRPDGVVLSYHGSQFLLPRD